MLKDWAARGVSSFSSHKNKFRETWDLWDNIQYRYLTGISYYLFHLYKLQSVIFIITVSNLSDNDDNMTSIDALFSDFHCDTMICSIRSGRVVSEARWTFSTFRLLNFHLVGFFADSLGWFDGNNKKMLLMHHLFFFLLTKTLYETQDP